MIIQTRLDKDKIYTTHAQPITEILKDNHELSKGDGWSEDKELRHLARIPTISYYEMLKKYPGIQDGDEESKQKEMYRALRDPEFSIFKLRHE